MNTKQNERISQVSSDTLVVGVDIGEEKHYARALITEESSFQEERFLSAIQPSDSTCFINGWRI